VYFGVVDYFAGNDEFSDVFADVEVVVFATSKWQSGV